MNHRKVLSLLLQVSGVLSFLIAIDATAQEVGPLSVEDALRTHVLGETSPLAFSPDGNWLAYMVKDNNNVLVGDAEKTYGTTGVDVRDHGDIWISDCHSGTHRNLTDGKGSNWEPTWSPDGRYLAFLSDRDGSNQAKVWVWDSVNDGLKLVSRTPVRAVYVMNPLLWTPDSRKLLITIIPRDLTFNQYMEIFDAPTEPQKASSSQINNGPTVAVYEAGSGTAHTADTRGEFNVDALYLHDVALIDIADGTETVVVRGKRIGLYSLSPDGTRLAYEALQPKKTEKVSHDVFAVNLITGETKALASKVRLERFSWSPDSSLIAYAEYGGEDRKTFDYSVVGLNGASPRKVSSVLYQEYCCLPRMPAWDPNGQYFYFVLGGALWRTSVSQGTTGEFARVPNRSITHRVWEATGLLWTVSGGKATIVVAHDDSRKQDGFYKIDLATGQSTQLLERGKCYTCKWRSADFGPYLMAVSRDSQRIAYLSEDAQHSPELWVSDASFRDEHQMTHMNPQFEKYKMGTGRLIDWLNDEGESLHGALLLPSDYHPGMKYPLIVWVYRGAHLSDSLDQFGFGTFPGPLNVQLLATRGYAILFSDAREKPGDPMASIAKSVLPGVNKVVEMGIADPKRLGVMGISGGGYSTLALIVQTTRFKAAMESDGWGSYPSYYGMMLADGSTTGYTQAEAHLGGEPWTVPLKYLVNSPVFYFDKVETPLFIAQGADDLSIPSFLADEIFVYLRRLRKSVQYAKYIGGGHAAEDWSYSNQLDLANRMIAWFDKYLKIQTSHSGSDN